MHKNNLINEWYVTLLYVCCSIMYNMHATSLNIQHDIMMILKKTSMKNEPTMNSVLCTKGLLAT